MGARNQGHPATSWYAQTANPFPELASLRGEHRTEVCIIGAGYTGLGAALRLAEQGVPTIVLEEAQVGSGASGRNGGQIHTGQRRDQQWLEQTVGPDDAMALWTLAQDAKAYLHGLIAQYAIACDLKPGMIEARHRPFGEDKDRAWRDHMAKRYGYDQIRLINNEALAYDLGTDVYFGGTVDEGGGHLHPLNLALGLGLAAIGSGAQIFERSRAVSWRKTAQGMEVTTQQGTVICQRLILTGDGYIDGLSPPLMPASCRSTTSS